MKSHTELKEIRSLLELALEKADALEQPMLALRIAEALDVFDHLNIPPN